MKTSISNFYINEPEFPGTFILSVVNYDSYSYVVEDFYLNKIFLPPQIYTSPKIRQSEFLAGRLAAKSVLELYKISDFVIKTGKYREPIWPSGICGSISHTNSIAIASIAKNSRLYRSCLGIDIQPIFTIKEGFDVFMSKDEYNLLVESNLDVLEFATILFSGKESFFKATFPHIGFRFDFDVISLHAIDKLKNTFYFRLNKSINNIFLKEKKIIGKYYKHNENIITIIYFHI